jgi:hypothetical protein
MERLGRTTRLRILLVIVVCAQLLALTLMPHERNMAMAWVSSNWGRMRVWWWQRHDPRPGVQISLAEHGIRVSAPYPAGIIAVNDCEGCSLAAVEQFASALHTENAPRLYVVSRHQEAQESIERLKLQCDKAGVQAEFLWDKTGTLHRILNPYFMPRAYTLGSDGALKWIQRPGERPHATILPQEHDAPLSEQWSRP